MKSVFKGSMPWILGLVAVWGLEFGVADALDPYFFMILMYAGINIILAVSLNLVNGFTGQFSMGHAGFMSVGGYAAAYLSLLVEQSNPEFMATGLGQTVVLLGCLLAGGLLAAGAGYLVGLPSLRLRGDYLAIVTLGFGEIIRVVILNIEAIGGPRGLPNIPALASFGWLYTWVVITVYFVWRIVRSARGRAFMAVREDEIAAESMGVNTTKMKVSAFVIGAFFAGVAGGLFAHYLRYLNPQAFDFNKSFEIIIMVVLGGMGSVTGSVVAAVFLTFIREALRYLKDSGFTQLDYRMVIYSLMLIVLMLTRPNGIFGTKELRDLLPRSWRRKLDEDRFDGGAKA